MSLRYNTRRPPAAFTLLEVIIALAILAGAVAVISQVSGSASRNATLARAETQAQLLARSIMNELLVGLIQFNDVTRQPLEADGVSPWVYSVSLDTTLLDGLNSVEVIVEQDMPEQFSPVKFSLVRWITTIPQTSENTEQSSTSSDDSGSGGSSDG